MSTSTLSLPSSSSHVQAQSQSRPAVVDPGYRLLTFRERVAASIFGCSHNYGWPINEALSARPITYPKGYDAHQTCTHCGAERFYSTSQYMVPGPRFIRTEPFPLSA